LTGTAVAVAAGTVGAGAVEVEAVVAVAAVGGAAGGGFACSAVVAATFAMSNRQHLRACKCDNSLP
jgi:hypothetical protein